MLIQVHSSFIMHHSNHSAFLSFIITTSIWHPQKYIFKQKNIKIYKNHQITTQPNSLFPSSIGLLWTFAKPMTFAVSSRSNARPLMPNPAAEPKGFWSKTLILRGRVWKISSWNHHGLPPKKKHKNGGLDFGWWKFTWNQLADCLKKISSRWFARGVSTSLTGNWKSFTSVENRTSEK